MSTPILIIGESGAGKSTSIHTLDPKETFIINVLNKPLPFRGWKKLYKKIKIDVKSNEKTNYHVPINHENLNQSIREISDKRPDIKVIVIDDFQYIMSNEFMSRASEAGWSKFTEIAQHAWQILKNAQDYREDLIIIFLAHSEVTDVDGKTRMKTIGKLLNEKISIEGMFTIVFHAFFLDGQYLFKTNADETTIAKSPMGMFETKTIPNDLKYVIDSINKYNEGE